MKTTLDAATLQAFTDRLTEVNAAQAVHYPGEATGRQPIHTVYGGAQLYKAETTGKLGQIALRMLDSYAPEAEVLAAALGLPGDAAMHQAVYERTLAKLRAEPVEDFRIDFEDGFGTRPDAEEDEHAQRTAIELARAMREGIAPPFIGIRVKTLSDELKGRAARTLDIFVSTLLEASGGVVPDGFVITLPKVVNAGQVSAFVDVVEALEAANGLATGTLQIELMVEATQAILGADGRSNLPLMLQATRGRCRGAHFGTYDYTATANVTAAHQQIDHPSCDFAKHMMMVAYAGTGVMLSDGATNVMPVGPHRGRELSGAQQAENRDVVHRAWKLGYDHIQHSLVGGFYQGWDLHPGQLPIRYAACYSFFLTSAQAAGERLTAFIAKAAQATLVGDVFDDAATGQGLLNFFLRALNCGAVTLDEVRATGLTLEEIQSRSFVKILENRKG